MIIKCKMCGGDIQFNQGDSIGQCDYCGCTSTIPRADDEQKLNRYNRANHYRRQGEFDKAITAYERILEEDDTDAEAHWGAVLSRFGIEYVEDPASGKRIPTCHRVRLESILADPDYLAAIENAPDAVSRGLYEDQAKQIAEIQKDILEISRNEKPYDVFICYKETDENGQRTRDSALAQEVYYGLTEKGYKVFFSRITLEDKLGQQYEPYIFAALNSAKVMVVIGTKPEFFNAVWVKNEWGRYLHLMKDDRKRLLIPCYRDMDPYDLPEELGNLQSQDMGKIGFMQDLIYGVNKVLADRPIDPAENKEELKEQSYSRFNPSMDSLLRRAYIFLEDGDWVNANKYAEKVLDIDAECGKAYLVRLLSDLQMHNISELESSNKLLEENSLFKRVMQHADEAMKNQMLSILNSKKLTYAKKQIAQAKTVDELLQIKKDLEKISMHEGACEQIKKCDNKISAIRETRVLLSQIEDLDMLIKERDALNAVIKQIEDQQENLYTEIIEHRRELEQVHGLFAKMNRKRIEEELNDCVTKYDENKKVHERSLKGYDVAVRKIESSEKLEDLIYKAANQYYHFDMYLNAVRLFGRIRNYKDVKDIINSNQFLKEADIQEQACVDLIKLLKKKKSVISFGRYFQSDNSDNGPEPIKWEVLDVKKDRSLLISKDIIDEKVYTTTYVPTAIMDNNVQWIYWGNSSIREWLNTSFLSEAFTDEERSVILEKKIDNNCSGIFGDAYSIKSYATEDKLFLLSVKEVQELRPSIPKAVKKIKNINLDIYMYPRYLLRTCLTVKDYSVTKEHIAYVISDGQISHTELMANLSGGIRPAFWIDNRLESWDCILPTVEKQ